MFKAGQVIRIANEKYKIVEVFDGLPARQVTSDMPDHEWKPQLTCKRWLKTRGKWQTGLIGLDPNDSRIELVEACA